MSLTAKPARSWCAAALISLCVVASASAQQSIAPADLLSVCTDALQFNPGYASARASYYAAKQLVPQARGKLLPQVGAFGMFSGRHDDQDGSYSGSFEVPELGLEYDTRFAVGGTDTYTRVVYGAQLTQALYRPQLTLGLSAAKLREEQAAFAITAAQDELLIGVAQNFFAVLAAQDALVFAHAETTALREQRDHVSARSEAGLATLADRAAAEAAYQLALVDESDAGNALLAARIALEAMTGRSYESFKVLPPELQLRAPEPLDEGVWTERTRTGNPAILGKQAGIRIAELTRQGAQRARYPQVDLVGTAYSLDNHGGVTGAIDNKNESIGVRLSVPLYTGGQIDATVRQSQEMEAKAKADADMTQSSAVLATRVAFLSASTGLQRIAALKRAVEAAKEAEQAARSGYDAGTRDNTDVLSAVEKRYAAERDYAAARYKFLLNSLQLKQLSGNLLTADLSLISRMLQPPRPALASTAP